MLLSEPQARFSYELAPVGAALDRALIDQDFDLTSWEMFNNWKERHGDRFGAGSPAPSIPQSQRQYDGDNCFDYCEIWIG